MNRKEKLEIWRNKVSACNDVLTSGASPIWFDGFRDVLLGNVDSTENNNPYLDEETDLFLAWENGAIAAEDFIRHYQEYHA